MGGRTLDQFRSQQKARALKNAKNSSPDNPDTKEHKINDKTKPN